LKPSEVVTNSRDQAFLEQVLIIVEDRMADEQFSVDVLASEAGMSRTNLNRKLRALVNQSSNQFIQSVRLQRAADLLRQQTGTVAEIAFQTGFSSTAYFVKCFKDKFGQTPGSFSENS
ncbi:helix-turn-helix transcriptional regulator, partial [Arthrospira platensis SPKY1]|nr:helix-turn-helix transcriptional regulator [Arthrospira platensis SPKY1]